MKVNRRVQKSYSVLACFVLLTADILFFAVQLFAQESEPSFRTVHGIVLNIDGSRAIGRDVRLIGLARGSTRPYSEHEKVINWDFKTDDQGEFSAKLGNFPTWGDKQQRPGWGCYVFVVLPSKSDAGAVSSHLLHNEKGEQRLQETLDEWGEASLVPPDGLDIELQIKKGVTLKGKILEYPTGERALAKVQVFTNNNLYSESHSGHGGEIFFQNATSDSNGNFEIKHIYPVKFSVALGPEEEAGGTVSAAHWLKTKSHHGEWIDDALDSLSPRADGTTMNLEIMAAAKSLFRYNGKVSDAAGNPLPAAKVTFGVSHHSSIATFDDEHSYQSTTTKEDGRFEIMLPTPWIRGMSVEAEGYERADQWKQSDAPFYRPAAYEFALKATTQ